MMMADFQYHEYVKTFMGDSNALQRSHLLYLVGYQIPLIDQLTMENHDLTEENRQLKKLLKRWLDGFTLENEAEIVADTEAALDSPQQTD